MINWFKKIIKGNPENINFDPMKYLIVGLGNKGVEYENTRHNVGFHILDELVEEKNEVFKNEKLAYKATIKYKGRILVLIKPTTYMNLSGKSVNYWMQKEKISIDKVLILVDDLALPFGTIRMKTKGSDGGHNGLADINNTLGHSKYPRLRFGIGDEFSKGKQVDYVLGKWNDREQKMLSERVRIVHEAIYSFVTTGADRTMNYFNGK